MTVAHDVFAETNPAFCTYVLTAFVTSYFSIKKDGPELPISYLALPLALSGDLASTFNGTNKNTGLLEWLERNPRIHVGLSIRINASMNIVTDAIRFACFARILQLNEAGCLQLGPSKLKKSAVKVLSDEPAQSIKHAERLGFWFAMAGSTRTVFNVMELTV
ncbi:three component ABC system middle component [Bradyrhizobium ottawaense]|uniref:three component ABC system middle component n=1 Tax=Bradyrhizobium ottawaense TaxID=931866 RepID=UPI0035155C26